MPFLSPEHDHQSCVAETLRRAELAFSDMRSRLTPLRRRVLQEIAGSHQAVGAYELMAALAGKGDRLAPISVYRALDALIAAGLVHRLESRNAFFACHAPHEPTRPQVVLACNACGAVAELSCEACFRALEGAARSVGFACERRIVEARGLCQNCARRD